MTSSIKVILSCMLGLIGGLCLFDIIGTPVVKFNEMVAIIVGLSIVGVISNTKALLFVLTCATYSFVTSIHFSLQAGATPILVAVLTFVMLVFLIDQIDKKLN